MDKKEDSSWMDSTKEKILQVVKDVLSDTKVSHLEYTEDVSSGDFKCRIQHEDGTEMIIHKQLGYHRMTHKKRQDLILETYLADTLRSGRQIAKLVGCTESTVRRNLAKHGYKLPHNKDNT